MAGFFNQFLQQIATGDQIKDYRHASKTFVDSLYRLSPKIGSMFHVFIDLNTGVANVDQTKQVEIGLMAKTATLPKFTIQNKTLNAYNRKNIVQERVNYDPVTLTFHDDSANVVRDFWYGYYSHYYRDADHQLPLYNMEHKYVPRQQQNWGFSPDGGTTTGTPSYINAIRIYSLHQKSFSSYILIRPTITSFTHGQHVQGEYVPLEHAMTIAYEAVKYETGQVSNGTVQGFNVVHYDNSPSPLTSIGGGTRSILGPGGLVEAGSDVVTDLANGNYLGAAIRGARTYTNFKNTNVKNLASAELKQTAMNILRGQNPQSRVFFPTATNIQEGLSKAVNTVAGRRG